jgi:hypothetical protein
MRDGGVGRLVNNRGLHSKLDYAPPEECEVAYYTRAPASQPATSQP